MRPQFHRGQLWEIDGVHQTRAHRDFRHAGLDVPVISHAMVADDLVGDLHRALEIGLRQGGLAGFEGRHVLVWMKSIEDDAMRLRRRRVDDHVRPSGWPGRWSCRRRLRDNDAPEGKADRQGGQEGSIE